MKKIILLLFPLLASCSCLLSQIPPQTIYADQNCEGTLPDYRTRVVASDNCQGEITITQTPVAGTKLTVANPSVNVTLTARDAFGNISRPVNVSVQLIDTVPPILSWPVGQLNMTEQDAVNIYANWEATVKATGIAHFMYDRRWTQGLALADTTYVDSCGVVHDYHVEDNLRYFTNTIKLTDEEYAQYVAIVNTKK